MSPRMVTQLATCVSNGIAGAILPGQTDSSMSAMTAPRNHLYVRRTIVQTANGWCRVYDVIDRARRPSLTDNQEQSHDGDFVQSLERGLSVIRAFDAEHSKLTLSEVATSTGLSRAEARRFLRTLVQLGYMRSDGSRFSLRH